jgi:hypothetical protein
MPDLPRRIRLAAGDYFMHSQDWRMRRAGLKGNVCRVALGLDCGLNTELLRQRVAASPMLDWLARVRISRRLPVFPPLWCATARPRAVFHEHDDQNGGEAGPGLLPQVVLGRELHAGRGPALALDLVRHRDGTRHLVLSWNHALMDARGSELILRHLNLGGAANGAPTIQNLIDPDQRGGNLLGWWRAVKLARGSLEWLEQSGRQPLFTLMPREHPGPATPCHNQARLLLFNEQEAARIDARCQRLDAGFRRSHFYLAASLRALHNVASARGNKDGAYLVPVPHDMRRRGANGPIFSNHLSILFYRIEPRQAVNLAEIIGELTRQMMDQIRTRFPESCMAALEMFKPLPLDFYLRRLGKPTRGNFASLCFSDSGETCAGMTDLLGGRIQEVTHMVPTWRPPGLTVLFWSFRGRPRAQLSWVDDCLSLAEVDTLETGLRSALLDEAP